MKLKEFLIINSEKISIEDSINYRIAGVQSYGKGIVIRRSEFGRDLTMKKYQVIKENQLMWCKVDNKNGAFGITKKEHIGALASTNMVLGNIDLNNVNPKFLELLFSIKSFYESINNLCTGATNRKYLKVPSLIEKVLIPNFSLEEQNNFLKLYKNLKINYDKFENINLENQNYIKLLKQSILQEAIEGKLTKTWREKNQDIEPASVLLERIKAEKEELIKQKKLKKQKELKPIEKDEIPFEIPESWEWCRLGEIGKIVGGGTPKTSYPEYFTPNEIPWLTPADLKGNKEKYISNGRKYISNLGLSKSSAQLLPKGTVLFSSRAPIGYVRISNNELSTNQGFKSIIPFIDISSEYLYYFLLKSGKEIDEKATGATFKEVSGTEVSRILFPVPPIKEQKEIVKKVDELMKLCDELEKQTLETKENSENLMKAVLGEVFNQKK